MAGRITAGTAAVNWRAVGRTVAASLALLGATAVVAHVLERQYPYLARIQHGLWWADSHHNLLRSFYVLHGLTLYRDVASNHFPGHHLLYAVALGALGYGRATPGPELTPAIERAGVFLTGVFQIGLLYAAGRLARLSRPVAFVLAGFLTYYLWEEHGYHLPVVETIHVCLMPTLVMLLYDILLPADPRTTVRSAAWLVSLAGVSTVLGLTVAPTMALWSAVAALRLAGVLWGAGPRAAGSWRALLRDPWVVGPLAGVTLVVLGSVAVVDVRGLRYWALEHTARGFRIDIGENLRYRFTTLPLNAFRFGDLQLTGRERIDPLGYPPVILALVGLLYLVLRRGPVAGRRFGIRYLGFTAVFLVGYWLVGWRYPRLFVNLKQIPAAGLGLGLIFVGFRAVLGGPTPRRWGGPVAAGAALAGAVALVWAAGGYRPPSVALPRHPAFDQSAVCRLGQRQGCRCVLQAGFDSRRFFEFDVHPCAGRSPDHPHVIAQVRETREQFLRDTLDPRIAFLVGNIMDIARFYDVPEEALSRLYGRRTCRPVSDLYSICVDPGREPRG